MNYDVFMSYRRKGGFETAKHISDLLVRDGYTVSFDLDTLREGSFDTQLLSRIDECQDFIIIIDQHAFDRTLDPSFNPEMDWMRIELSHALRMRKNIIPILLSGASIPDNLPDDIQEITRQNRPEYSQEYFDAFFQKLKRFLHSVPLNGMMNKQGATISLYTDTDCFVKEAGRILAEVPAEDGTSITLQKGRHRLTFINKRNPNARQQMNYEVTDIEYHDTIDIVFSKPAEKKKKGPASMVSNSPKADESKSAKQKSETTTQLRKEKLTPSPDKEAQLWQKVKVSKGDYYVSLSKRGLKEQTIAFLSTLPGITTDLAENYYKIAPVSFISRISKQSALDIQRQIEILGGEADINLAPHPKPAVQTVPRSTSSRATPSWWGYSVVLKDMGSLLDRPLFIKYLKALSYGVTIPISLNNDKLPFTIAKGISHEQAESIKKALEYLGAKAYIS